MARDQLSENISAAMELRNGGKTVLAAAQHAAPLKYVFGSTKETTMARNKKSEDRDAAKSVRVGDAQAEREFNKAEVATQEALDGLKETTRELTEKIEEVRAHIGVSAEDGEAAPILTDPFRPRLPLAASLPA